MMWNGGWSGMFLGPLVMIVFIAVIVVLVVFVVRRLGGIGHATSQYPPTEKTPLDILKERFAQGEIEKEEFEDRRRILGD